MKRFVLAGMCRTRNLKIATFALILISASAKADPSAVGNVQTWPQVWPVVQPLAQPSPLAIAPQNPLPPVPLRIPAGTEPQKPAFFQPIVLVNPVHDSQKPNVPSTQDKAAAVKPQVESNVEPATSGVAKVETQSEQKSGPKPVARTAKKPEASSVASGITGWMKGKWNAVKSFVGTATKTVSGGRMPSSEPAPTPKPVNPAGLKENELGVAVYDLASEPNIPRVWLDKEEQYTSSRFALETKMQKIMNDRIIHPFPSPELVSEEKFKALKTIATGQPRTLDQIPDPVFSPKGKVSRADFDRIIMDLKPEAQLALRKFEPLNADDTRFLSGLLLFQQGDKCAAAVGLFHRLSRLSKWEAESNYYLSMCSKKLGLTTDFLERARRVLVTEDVYYVPKILDGMGHDVPYEFIVPIGKALLKVADNEQVMSRLSASAKDDMAFLLASYGAHAEKYNIALAWSKKVPSKHPKSLQSRFIQALGEFHAGSKQRALKMQEDLVATTDFSKAKSELHALIALNVARMHFQEENFNNARKSFLKVYKDHPLWLQSLTEMGWAQLMAGDYEGAIGNMYSIHSPFFSAVYKPESFVIRTIGYLNLCQYGDAYRTLTILEHEYRPQLDMLDNYMKSNSRSYYQTVRTFLKSGGSLKEVDGLPGPVIREMARHRDFINLQKSLNRQYDEREVYAKLDEEINKSVKRAQWIVNNSRKTITELRRGLGLAQKYPEWAKKKGEMTAQLKSEIDKLNSNFFEIDLYKEAKAALPAYRKEVVSGVDTRIAGMRGQMEKILEKRIRRMKTELATILDNNELLRYEVFAGSGENIRFEVAGGQKSNRVPASVVPKSKSLKWEFDGEYWEDEVGHYRSSLKNNCPEHIRREQASLQGGN